MEAVKEKSRLEQGTLLAAALLCAANLVLMFRDFNIVRLLWVAVLGFLCWLLFTNGKEKLFGYAFYAVAAVAVIDFFAGFSRGLYSLSGYGAPVENFFSVLPGLLMLLSVLGTAALGTLRYAGKFPALGDKLREYWYVPALLFAVTLVYALLFGAAAALFAGRWWGMRGFVNLTTLLWGVFALLLGMKVSGRESLPQRSAPEAEAPAPALRRCSMAKLLFLSLITLGIWGFVWVFRTTAALRAYEDRHPRRPLFELLFCLLLPFYGIYWCYKSAQLVEKASGENARFDVLCLVMAVLLPPVAMILIQDKINLLADEEEPAEEALELFRAEEVPPADVEPEEESEPEPQPEPEPEPEAAPEPEPEPEAEAVPEEQPTEEEKTE